MSEDEINHIKYDILKNGAKWFCEHLTAGNDGNWFGNASLMELRNVAGEMQQLIDKVIKDEFI